MEWRKIDNAFGAENGPSMFDSFTPEFQQT